jgi:glycosyltransferase involved in cell wall biosynthesis
MNRMSRVGINLLFINPKLAGGSITYAKKVVASIALLDTETEYYIYIHQDCKVADFELGKNFTVRVLPFSYSSVYLRYLWEQFVLPFYLEKDKVDLVHSLGYVTPILTRKTKIVSILDINYQGHGGQMKFSKRVLLGSMVNLSAWFSKKIITISYFSKDQIVKYTKADANKVIVTYLSGSNDLPFEGKSISKDVLEKYNLIDPYIIAFSSPSPHKNIENLLLAFKILVATYPSLKLLLVGHQNKSQALMEVIKKEGLYNSIVFTGFVPDEEVNPLIAGAKVFVFPSRYEGFGIPILDAQMCQVPIASSNAGSLPEVGGKSVSYFNPENPNEMAKAIQLFFEDKSYTESIIKDSLVNRNLFSWEKTAKETLLVYQRILNKE